MSNGIIKSKTPAVQMCNRPGATHPKRRAKWQLSVVSNEEGRWGVEGFICEQCYKEFKSKFGMLLTFHRAKLEPL